MNGPNLKVTVDNFTFSSPRFNVLFEERTETPSDPLEKVWYGLSRVEEVFKSCVYVQLLHEAVWNKHLRTSPP